MNPQPNQNPASSDGDSLRTDIVSNIPIHEAAAAAPVKEDDDLDRIMQDVGHQLKTEDIKPPKHHLFSKKQPANSAHLSAQPVIHEHQAPTAQTPHNQPAQKPPPKSKSTSSAPVFIIVVTIAVTTVLIAAAMAAYKK
jgi:hypothetical protein